MGRSEQQELEATGCMLSTVKKQKVVEVRDMAAGCTTTPDWILTPKTHCTTRPYFPHHPPHDQPFPTIPTDSIGTGPAHTSWKNRLYRHRYISHQAEEQEDMLDLDTQTPTNLG